MAGRRSELLVITPEQIQGSILPLRGQRVMLDEQLATLYGVGTKRLNEAVRRNKGRFPTDFMFQLSHEEWESLRSQIATANGRGGRRTLPYAFTQEGVAMLSSVLNSERAVRVNVEIMRAFIRFRGILARNGELAGKLRELEDRLENRLAKHDKQIAALFEAIRRLMEKSTPHAISGSARRPIGFHAAEKVDDPKKPKARKKTHAAAK